MKRSTSGYITAKYFLALSIIAALSLAAYFLMRENINVTTGHSKIINSAGRQRMLSQRISFMCHQLYAGKSIPGVSDLRGELRQHLDLLEKTHDALIHGSEKMGLEQHASETLRKMYFEPEVGADALLKKFIAAARAISHTPAEQMSTKGAELNTIGDLAFNSLLNRLDLIANQYVRENIDDITHLKHLERITLGATFVALLGTILLVFRPMKKRIDAEMSELNGLNVRLQEERERYSLALDGSRDGIWDWDVVTNEIVFSRRWFEQLGYTESAKMQTSTDWFAGVHEEDLPVLKTKIQAHLENQTPFLECEYRMKIADGSWRWMLCRGKAHFSEMGQPLRMVGSQTDISYRKRIEDQLRGEATYDKLTGLLNRNYFETRLSGAVDLSRRYKHSVSLCLCDIDYFKQINDTHGHLVGDEVLTSFAQLLKERLRQEDFAGRFGGDEFCICFAFTSAEHSAESVERIRHEFERTPFTAPDGKVFFVTASFGIVNLPITFTTLPDFFKKADEALYESKRNGRNCVCVVT